jgi:hypothetical protein
MLTCIFRNSNESELGSELSKTYSSIDVISTCGQEGSSGEQVLLQHRHGWVRQRWLC